MTKKTRKAEFMGINYKIPPLTLKKHTQKQITKIMYESDTLAKLMNLTRLCMEDKQ